MERGDWDDEKTVVLPKPTEKKEDWSATVRPEMLKLFIFFARKMNEDAIKLSFRKNPKADLASTYAFLEEDNLMKKYSSEEYDKFQDKKNQVFESKPKMTEKELELVREALGRLCKIDDEMNPLSDSDDGESDKIESSENSAEKSPRLTMGEVLLFHKYKQSEDEALGAKILDRLDSVLRIKFYFDLIEINRNALLKSAEKLKEDPDLSWNIEIPYIREKVSDLYEGLCVHQTNYGHSCRESYASTFVHSISGLNMALCKLQTKLGKSIADTVNQ